MKFIQTAERISHQEDSDNVIFQRSIFAYHEAAKYLKGKLLEIGTGMGYGFEVCAPKVDKYFAVDKYSSEIIENNKDNPDFIFSQQNVPPLSGIENDFFDFVISFQVIEHIKNDNEFVKEISRVLKTGGKTIVTTPNIKMSLTRNPWHIREYTKDELKQLFLKHFSKVEVFGVYAHEKPLKYYLENKKSVQKFKRLDFLNLEYRLPRQVLQIPYDILNRINRKKLMDNANEEVLSITKDDFYLENADDQCFDLFIVAEK